MPRREDSPAEATEKLEARSPSIRTNEAALIIYHRDGTRLVPIAGNRSVIVGRGPPSDIIFEERSLSRRHARFELINDELWVFDLASTNGTMVNGERVDRARVAMGDEVTLGVLTAAAHRPPQGEREEALDGHDEFMRLLERELPRARFTARPSALILVRAAEPAQLSRWVPRVRELLRPFDRAGLYGRSAIEILLPDATSDYAMRIAEQITASGGEGPDLCCGVAMLVADGASADEVFEAALRALRGTGPTKAARPASDFTGLTWSDPQNQQDVIAESAVMQDVLRIVRRVANAVVPVLIRGETGTGKELIARAIHDGGARAAKRVCTVNCGAIPAQLLESTLFGHAKGAFTGADSDSKGVFRAAEGGTVFLDELGELSPSAQVALLRVLEAKTVTPVGSTDEVSVDVRVVAATHRDLEQMCEAGEFRWDLFYRLDVMSIELPALRDRVEDIRPLVRRFLRSASEANGFDIATIEEPALRILERYTWRGNVRELRNVIERAVVICQDDAITVADLPRRLTSASDSAELIAATRAPSAPPPASSSPALVREEDDVTRDLRTRLALFEARAIVEALDATEGNQTEAAKQLGLPRRTLLNKMKSLAIKRGVYQPAKASDGEP